MLGYAIHADIGIVEITGGIDDHPGAIGDHMRRVTSDPSYRPEFSFLRDRRGLPALTAAQAVTAAQLPEFFPVLKGSRWAIVVDTDVSYGASRVHQALAEIYGVDVAVFRNGQREAAMAWLTGRGKGPTATVQNFWPSADRRDSDPQAAAYRVD